MNVWVRPTSQAVRELTRPHGWCVGGATPPPPGLPRFPGADFMARNRLQYPRTLSLCGAVVGGGGPPTRPSLPVSCPPSPERPANHRGAGGYEARGTTHWSREPNTHKYVCSCVYTHTHIYISISIYTYDIYISTHIYDGMRTGGTTHRSRESGHHPPSAPCSPPPRLPDGVP